MAYGPLARYVKLRVAHAPGMPGTFSAPPRACDPDMHHGTCVTHVPWCIPGSLTSGFLWSRWRGKRSRHSRRMRNPQFYVSGKKPMVACPFRTMIALYRMFTFIMCLIWLMFGILFLYLSTSFVVSALGHSFSNNGFNNTEWTSFISYLHPNLG